MLANKPIKLPLNSHNMDVVGKKRLVRSERRFHSLCPKTLRKSPPIVKKDTTPTRRCHSLAPSMETSKQSLSRLDLPQVCASAPDAGISQTQGTNMDEFIKANNKEKDPVIPQCVLTKLMRSVNTKKRDFMKLRKTILQQQNTLLEQYAALKELEKRAGVTGDESVGEVKLVSVKGWPAHDLLMLVRNDLNEPMTSELSSLVGSQTLQQIQANLNPIPEEVLGIGAEIMARRIDLLNLIRGRNRIDRGASHHSIETKHKTNEFDVETERLHRLVAGTVENLKAKINHCLDLCKIPWLDRDILIKKLERLQKENLIYQNKLEDLLKKTQASKEVSSLKDGAPSYETICEELSKEKSAREALREVVSAAESMLRAARARITSLERQLKDAKNELDAAKKKHKDLEQLVNSHLSQPTFRHRENSYDARSKKLMQVSKTGEMTIETLSKQRDALELRVKELREQVEAAEKQMETKEHEQKHRIDVLQAKVAEQEKNKKCANDRVIQLENKVKELEEQLQAYRERSIRLVDMERKRCMDYLPQKAERKPSVREAEIWKELQVTKLKLSRAEEELRQSRADKDAFLESLSRIAKVEDVESSKEKMAFELVDREKKITNLQQVIKDLKENEKQMEHSMTQYENQLASLRLEIKQLRNYSGYKEIPNQELETELLDLHMQVETLVRERNQLKTAAASRALMLERHERAAELFARMIRARQDLTALIEGKRESPAISDENTRIEVSRSLTSLFGKAAETWNALQEERARILQLENAVMKQTTQLEREERVRTQLERRRSVLERQLLRIEYYGLAEAKANETNDNPTEQKVA